MSFFQNFRQLRQQHVQFRAGFQDARAVDQSGMNGGLAQPEERFQDMYLGFFQAILFDAI